MRLEDIYDAADEQGRLVLIVWRWFLRMLTAQNATIGSVLVRSPDDFRVDDEATRKMLALGADRVTLIDRATRDALREVLQEGQRTGYSDHEIAHGVPKDGFGGIRGLYLDTWKGRAETIARTEIATASLAASLDRYAATGVVTHVQIVEHRDTDAPCAARNGQVVPLASKPGLLHPNCEAGFIPVVDEAA